MRQSQKKKGVNPFYQFNTMLGFFQVL